MSKNKKRIEIAREILKELRHKFSKSDLKTIKRHLYNTIYIEPYLRELINDHKKQR